MTPHGQFARTAAIARRRAELAGRLEVTGELCRDAVGKRAVPRFQTPGDAPMQSCAARRGDASDERLLVQRMSKRIASRYGAVRPRLRECRFQQPMSARETLAG